MKYSILLPLILLLAMALPASSATGKKATEELLRQCEEARSMSRYGELGTLSGRLLRLLGPNGDKRAMGYGHLYAGLAQLFTGYGEQASKSLDRAWTLSRQTGNDSIGALVLNARGIYQAMYENNNFMAQQFFFQSLDLAEESHYETLKIRVYGNLLILSKSAIDREGFSYARSIYRYGVGHNDVEQEFMGAYYLALYYKLKGNYKAALNYVSAALKLYNSYRYADVASVYVLYSEVETELNHLDRALTLAQKADTLARHYGQTNLYPDVLLQLAQVQSRQGRLAESCQNVMKALTLSEEHSLSNRVIDCYRLLADNYVRMGNSNGAINALLKANAGMDTLSRTNMERLMREREMMSKMQRQQRQDEQKRQQIESQHRAIVMMLSITVILLAALIIILLVLRSRNRLIKRVVAQNVKALEQQQKARQRIAEMEKAQAADSQTDKPSARLLDDTERKQQFYDSVCELMEREKPYKIPQLTREKLAAMLGTNRTYLSTVIHEKSGMSYQQFINSYRINEAVRILSDRKAVDYPLKQLWSDLGFTSSSTFYKLFQQSVGITPSVYRKQFLEMEEPLSDSDD